MQLNGANLLIAAQQAARQTPVQPNAKAFASALADTKSGDSFAPLDFKQTAAPAAARPAATPAQPARMGSQLDIRI